MDFNQIINDNKNPIPVKNTIKLLNKTESITNLMSTTQVYVGATKGTNGETIVPIDTSAYPGRSVFIKNNHDVDIQILQIYYYYDVVAGSYVIDTSLQANPFVIKAGESKIFENIKSLSVGIAFLFGRTGGTPTTGSFSIYVMGGSTSKSEPVTGIDGGV